MVKNISNLKGLLVDFDGTLVDFKKAELNAFTKIMLESFISKSKIHEINNEYIKIDHALWNLFEKQKITLPDLQHGRFRQLMEVYPEIKENPSEINKKYLQYLIHETYFYENVYSSLKNLQKSNIKVIIITNGIDWVQKERVNKLKLNPLINGMLTSDQVGYSKPHPAMFEKGIELLQLDKSEIWVVGDNPQADIEGASNIGLSSCLITESLSKEDNNSNPDIIVNSFPEFVKIILKN